MIDPLTSLQDCRERLEVLIRAASKLDRQMAEVLNEIWAVSDRIRNELKEMETDA